jgi:hypothetical protein
MLRLYYFGTLRLGVSHPVGKVPVLTTEEEVNMTHHDCLEYGNGACAGETVYRMSLTGTGTRIPRCDRHWDLRLERESEYRQYDSPIAPDWFDPTYAGERWDADY